MLEVQEAAVVEEIARFYDQRGTDWLPDAVADMRQAVAHEQEIRDWEQAAGLKPDDSSNNY